MRCYFSLVSSDQIITDEEGLEVADVEEAQALARETITERVQEGAAEEIARWRGWALEARDASGTVLFTMGFDALVPEEVQAAEASPTETYAYDKAA
jgi:hypothetical protein